jgi:predicted GIY-YIG superfamily endonuclease
MSDWMNYRSGPGVDSWPAYEGTTTYLYALVASDFPRTIRYVGITKDPAARARQHAKRTAYGHGVVGEWRRELAVRGASITLIVMETHPTRSAALEREWRTIARLKRRGMCDLNLKSDGAAAWHAMVSSPSFRRDRFFHLKGAA